ncbi:MAG TPA: histidine phosphotransferase family protein [Candidatus Cybelea sp.]|nr:histidine phosphotransferase family protein [Candidatus Cybelea sp.]
MPSLKLTALLCSRLCHDLIGPIGALSNGVEILMDEDEAAMREQATQLLGESAEEAARRLRFYRLAFGAAGSMGQTIPLSEARAAALGIYEKGRISLDWPLSEGEGGIDKSTIKLLLNVVLVAAASLPRGGTLAVRPGAGRSAFAVAATGAGARIDPETRTALSGSIDEALIDTHNVVACHVAALAEQQGVKLMVETPSEGVARFVLELGRA